MRRYVEYILGHRLLVLALVAVVSAAAAGSISRGVFASSMVRLFFGESDAYKQYVALSRRFVSANVVLIAYEDEALLTKTGLARLSRIDATIAKRPSVHRVSTLASAQRIERAGEEELEVSTYASFAETAGEEELKKAVLGDEIVASLLVGKDAKSTAVSVEFREDDNRPIEEVSQDLDEIYGIFAQEGVPRDRLHVAGTIAETVEATSQARFTIGKIFPVTILVVIAIVYLLFFRLWPVVLTVGITGVAVVWTFGFAVAVDREINVTMALVPGMMMVVGFSDVVHLYSAFVRQIAAGVGRREAIVYCATHVGTACAFTAVTEFIGFMSFVFIPTPLMRMAGIVLGFGVGATLFLVLTLVPIFFSVVPLKDLSPRKGGIFKDRTAPFLDGFVRSASTLSLKRPWAVIAIFSALTGIAIYGITRLRVETEFVKRMAADNHIRVAREFMRERFASPYFIDVYVTAKEPGGLLDPATFAKLETLSREVERLEGVDRTLSFVDVIRQIHEKIGVADQPLTREALAQYFVLFEVSGGSGLEQLIDEERTTMRVAVRVSSPGVRGVAETGHQVRAATQKTLGDGFTVIPTGMTFLLGDWLDDFLQGQVNGLWFSISTIALVLIVVFRSVRSGLASIVPNLLPIIFLGGLLGLAWDSVDSDVFAIASIAMGIAVDDTIHFVTTFRTELGEGASLEDALSTTIGTTGRAILQASTILCAGFAPFALSDYFSTWMMGTLLPFTLLIALVTEVFLTPALAKVGIIASTPKKLLHRKPA